VTIHPDVVFRVLDDGAVLVDLSTNQVFELNTSGAFVWERVTLGDAPDAIVDAVIARFDVDRDAARGDVTELLAALASRGLVRP